MLKLIFVYLNFMKNLQPNQIHRTLQFMKYYFHYENITMDDTKKLILDSLTVAMDHCLNQSNKKEEVLINDYNKIK